MSSVELEQLTKKFPDDTLAVDRLSIDISDGSFLAIVGPSGCGKTTALRMVAGLESISAGELRIDGVRTNELPPGERDMAMIFQDYALYPHLSIADNIGFPLRMQRVAKAERSRRIREVATLLELEHLLDRRPAQLSGGQRQRVAMGRAIIRKPHVFLMDEPLSNLDARLRTQVRADIVRLQRDVGTTTLYVTHDQVEAMTMADRVAVMRDGVLQQHGSPQEIFDAPANGFVATFLGAPPMNLLIAHRRADALESGRYALLPADDMDSHDPVAIGVRPEDLSTGRSSDPQTFPVDVDLVERLGRDVAVHAVPPDGSVEARSGRLTFITTTAQIPQAGERLWLSLDADRAHRFAGAGDDELAWTRVGPSDRRSGSAHQRGRQGSPS